MALIAPNWFSGWQQQRQQHQQQWQPFAHRSSLVTAMRRGSDRRRPAAVLAVAASMALAFAAVTQQFHAWHISASGSAFVGTPSRQVVVCSRSIIETADAQRQVRLFARGGDETEVATAPAEVTDVPMPAPVAEQAIIPLFQELFVSNWTNASAIKGAVIAIFNKGERAVDLVITNYNAKHIPMYTLASLPKNFKSSAQVLLRKRDRRLRVRIMQHAEPPPNKDGEWPHVFRLHAESNITRVANLIKYQFVDPFGNNLKRQVKLEFAGRAAAAKALMSIEQTMQLTNREFTFAGRFEEVEGTPKPQPPAEAADAPAEEEAPPAADPPTKTIQFSVFVTAT